jgi:hypothetical protein
MLLVFKSWAQISGKKIFWSQYDFNTFAVFVDQYANLVVNFSWRIEADHENCFCGQQKTSHQLSQH